MDAYCINLDEDKERWEKINNHVKELNLDFNIIRIPAIKHKTAKFGCAMSHQKAIEIAKEKNLDNILVIEDDIKFNENSYKYFQEVIQQLPEDWDIMNGGPSWVFKVGNRVSDNLVKLGDFSGTHFMFYNKKSYDIILSWKWNCGKTNIDRYLGLCSRQNKINIYSSSPFIATQFPGFSRIRNRNTNDDNLFKKTENIIKNRS